MTRQLPDLDDLATLVLVAKSGSIGAAAQALGVSQPSVSRRMSQLERSLRVPLLQRSRRGSTLTPAGRVVVDWASTLLNAAADFTRSVGALSGETAVTVRAGASMTIAEHYAPAWIARLQARSPKASVSLVVNNSKEVAEAVESGGADLGFIESPTVRRTLNRRRVAWDHLVVAVPPAHPWSSRRKPVDAGELAHARLLMREAGSGTRETIEHVLRRQGLEIAEGFVMASNTALKSAALVGMGPVVLSELALAGEIATGELVRVDVADVDMRRPLTAVWRRGEPLSGAAAELLKIAAAG
jgi:DNA-binding transcriptional LysR family regulator